MARSWPQDLYAWSRAEFARCFPRLDESGNILPAETPEPSTAERVLVAPRPWPLRAGEREATHKPKELRCEEQLAVLDGGSPRCSALVLHATQPLLVTASAREEISVWDYLRRQRLNAFANGNPAGSRCTSSLLLGADDELLAVASSEGCVRVWRRWDAAGEQQLVNGWTAVDRPADHGSRDPWSHALAITWQPQQARMSASRGGSPWLRVWDLHHERCVQQSLVGSPTVQQITSLTADVNSPLLVVGSGNGIVATVDPRLPPSASTVVQYVGSATAAPIVSVCMQACSNPWVVSGSSGGEIKLFEPRRASGGLSTPASRGDSPPPAALHSITSHKSNLSALVLHPSVPLLASGSRNQFIKLYDLSAMRDSGQARELSTIRYFDGFLGARIGPVTCLAIHPQKVLLGVGATDSVVSIYSA